MGCRLLGVLMVTVIKCFHRVDLLSLFGYVAWCRVFRVRFRCLGSCVI